MLQTALKQRESIAVFGEDYPTEDGTCIRDYIHVSDLADAHVRAVNYLRGGNSSNFFNLGNGTGFSVKEVIETAKEVTGLDIPVVIQERRAGDPAVLVASSEKARSVLGWNPTRADLKDIIQSAWSWHSSHPQGYGEA
ncbi:UDP-glucose 4-epimerase [compost metagenome]